MGNHKHVPSTIPSKNYTQSPSIEITNCRFILRGVPRQVTGLEVSLDPSWP